MKSTVKVTKKVLKYPCYCCKKSIRGKTLKQKECKVCKGTGFFTDEIYYHFHIGKDGKAYCIDGDTMK